MKIIKIFFLIISLNFIALISNAANVSCNFDTGESYNITDGSWEGSLGWESLYDLFGDGLTLPLENSLSEASTFKKLITFLNGMYSPNGTSLLLSYFPILPPL